MAKHKYGAKPKVVDGIRFASTKEANRYAELKLREKAGDLLDLILQPRFALKVPYVSGFVQDGTHSEAIEGLPLKIGEYRGDFQYRECDHGNGHRGFRTVVEDVKGFKTPLYRWKKKHVEAQYGIQIREI